MNKGEVSGESSVNKKCGRPSLVSPASTARCTDFRTLCHPRIREDLSWVRAAPPTCVETRTPVPTKRKPRTRRAGWKGVGLQGGTELPVTVPSRSGRQSSSARVSVLDLGTEVHGPVPLPRFLGGLGTTDTCGPLVTKVPFRPSTRRPPHNRGVEPPTSPLPSTPRKPSTGPFVLTHSPVLHPIPRFGGFRGGTLPTTTSVDHG